MISSVCYGFSSTLAFIAIVHIPFLDASRSPGLQTFKVIPKSIEEQGAVPICRGLDFVNRKCGVIPHVNVQGLEPSVAGFGEFPWQVAIIDSYEQLFMCSGALIGSRTVLTATTCVGEMLLSDIRVRVGEWNILNDGSAEEPFGIEDIPVSKKYIFTEFNRLTGHFSNEAHNSIAILKLKRDVQFDLFPHVTSICLPKATVFNYTDLSNCFVAGWGGSPVQLLKVADAETPCETSSEVEANAFCDVGYPVMVAGHTFCLGQNLDAPLMEDRTELLEEESNPDEMEDQEPTDASIHLPEEIQAQCNPSETPIPISRVLNKASVTVATRSECYSRLGNDTMNLKSTQLCIFASGDSEPCKADIGSPVVCQVGEVPLGRKNEYMTKGSKSNKKFLKQNEDPIPTAPQFAVVAVISKMHPCSANDTEEPLVAISISRMMDFICRTISNHL